MADNFANKRKFGFTLAEVLITLGIIGVVAAITLPSVVKHYQHKALETAFKKSYSNLYNALNKALIDNYEIGRADKTTGVPPIREALLKEYSKVRDVKSVDVINYRKSVKTYTKTKGAIPECSQNSFQSILPDGSAIGLFYNCGATWVSLDTNGLQKGPNAYGHDSFLFFITEEGKLIPATSESEANYDDDGNRITGSGFSYNNTPENKNKCSKNATSMLNGVTCAQFAIENKCPDDNTKTYWECLP